MDFSYALTPFLAWLVAGVSKFIINSIKAKQLAFGLIGYGGLPSNHSAIVSSMAALIALKEGIGHPAFGVAITLAFIVMLDANSLRRQVGKHAESINKLTLELPARDVLRERMGHSLMEIVAGVIVGVITTFAVEMVVGGGLNTMISPA
jgi:acid phosphatase family membrane protein YuiD